MFSLAMVSVLAALLLVATAHPDASVDNGSFKDHLSSFETSIKERDENFQQYATMMEQALAARMGEIDSEMHAVSSDLEARMARVRTLKLQLGQVHLATDQQSVSDVLSGAANSLVECISARHIHEASERAWQDLTVLIGAAKSFNRALTKGPTATPAQTKCLDTLHLTLESTEAAAHAAIHAERRDFNATTGQCVQAQQHIASEASWATVDEIPMMEDMLAMQHELKALDDVASDVRARLDALKQERELKQARLDALRVEMGEHVALVRQQTDSVDRLRALVAGLK